MSLAIIDTKMNAVIALCHFCELHGPSILFCTQPFHCVNHSPKDVLDGVVPTPSACGITQNRLYRSRSISESEKTEDEGQGRERSSSQARQSTCDACRSLQSGDPGFISIDKESHISYVSMQYPEEQELYRIIRHACVRSLSCEVCPGREGPIMFGDEASGYVFSYTFFLKDSQSRGFQRWYSIICVMMDRIYLMNSMPFLIDNFKSIIEELQSKAEVVYKNEQFEQPQRASRLQHSSANTILTPDQFRRSRGGQIYRSLVDITKDKSIFHNLHQLFAWILKAAGQRYTETLLEGPPVEDYLYDVKDQSGLGFAFDGLHLESDAFDRVSPIFFSLKQMHEVLGDEKFSKLAFHVVRGDQVIVQGSSRRTVQSALWTLKHLIPAGCVKCLPFEDEYKDSWRCNFLGLRDSVEIPAHVYQSQLYVLLSLIDVPCSDEIEEVPACSDSVPSDSGIEFCAKALHRDKTETVEQELEESVNKTSKERDEMFSSDDSSQTIALGANVTNDFSSIEFTVKGSSIDKEPTYLIELLQALRNDAFVSSVFETILVTLKEQWMSKVKVMFKFSKGGARTSEEKDKLLKVLNAKPEDEILLKFWMISLSKSYRTHLLSCQDRRNDASS